MSTMFSHMRTKKEGFTLAELLIVVAIILVLVAIAIPVFSGVFDQAEKSVEAANMRVAKAGAALEYQKTNDKTLDMIYFFNGNGDVASVKRASGEPGPALPAGTKYAYEAIYQEYNNTIDVQKYSAK